MSVIDGEIHDKQKQLDALQAVRENIRSSGAIPVETISDIERMMNSRKKLKKVHGTMLAAGIVMDVILISTALLWAFKGYWKPFAAGFPVVILLGVLLTGMYHRNTAYICPECSSVFQPSTRKTLFSKHTPKARKLTCPACGHTGYCVETATGEKASVKEK